MTTRSRRRPGSSAPLVLAVALAACSSAESAGPRPARIVPDSAIEGAATPVRVEGEGLTPAVYTDFSDGDASRIGDRFVLRLGPNSLRDVRPDGGGLAATVPPDVAPGVYDLLVVDPEGRRGTLERAFRVNAAAVGQPVAAYRFDPVTTSQLAGVPFQVTVTATDSAGSAVTSFSGEVALSDVTGTVVPLRLGLFANGQWTGFVEVRATSPADVLTATDDQGHAGSSASFKVN